MGYRSQVVIALSIESYTKHSLLIKDLPTLLSENKPQKHEQLKAVFWSFDEIRWYDAYSDISEIGSFLSELNEEDYGFIRIGEEINDIDIEGNIYIYDMCVYRELNYPFGD